MSWLLSLGSVGQEGDPWGPPQGQALETRGSRSGWKLGCASLWAPFRSSIFQERKQTESCFLCEISQLQTVCHKVMM